MPILPPISRPSDCDMMENAPPDSIRMFVVIEAIDRLVHRVMITEIPTMIMAPATPAFPTTQGCRMYMITPRMVRTVGVNTPWNVPKYLVFRGLFRYFNIKGVPVIDKEKVIFSHVKSKLLDRTSPFVYKGNYLPF